VLLIATNGRLDVDGGEFRAAVRNDALTDSCDGVTRLPDAPGGAPRIFRPRRAA
jgi:hypothetical protein